MASDADVLNAVRATRLRRAQERAELEEERQRHSHRTERLELAHAYAIARVRAAAGGPSPSTWLLIAEAFEYADRMLAKADETPRDCPRDPVQCGSHHLHADGSEVDETPGGG